MVKTKRSVTLSTELDESIAKLSISRNMNYSEFLDSRLRQVPEISQMVEKIKSLPEMPKLSLKKKNLVSEIAKLSEQLAILNQKVKIAEEQKLVQNQLLRA